MRELLINDLRKLAFVIKKHWRDNKTGYVL